MQQLQPLSWLCSRSRETQQLYNSWHRCSDCRCGGCCCGRACCRAAGESAAPAHMSACSPASRGRALGAGRRGASYARRVGKRRVRNCDRSPHAGNASFRHVKRWPTIKRWASCARLRSPAVVTTAPPATAATLAATTTSAAARSNSAAAAAAAAAPGAPAAANCCSCCSCRGGSMQLPICCSCCSGCSCSSCCLQLPQRAHLFNSAKPGAEPA